MRKQERRFMFWEVSEQLLLLHVFILVIITSFPPGNWKEGLQKYISPHQLPQVYGGTRCEPDPCCSNYVGFSLAPLSLSLSLSLSHTCTHTHTRAHHRFWSFIEGFIKTVSCIRNCYTSLCEKLSMP